VPALRLPSQTTRLAADLVELSQEEQADALGRGKEGVRSAVKALRERKSQERQRRGGQGNKMKEPRAENEDTSTQEPTGQETTGADGAQEAGIEGRPAATPTVQAGSPTTLTLALPITPQSLVDALVLHVGARRTADLLRKALAAVQEAVEHDAKKDL
jgi:hypothetical protein